MNQAIQHILRSSMAVLFLLSACAPVSPPAETENPEVIQLQQTVEALSAAQNTQPTPDPRLGELLQKIDLLATAQISQSTQDPELDELKQQVGAIATQQKTLNDALLNPAAAPTDMPTLPPTLSATTGTPQAESGSMVPAIEGVNPSRGEAYGEMEVTITGQNFSMDEPNKTRFTFGGNEATIVSCEKNATCKVVLPPASDQGSDSSVPIQAINGANVSQERIMFTYLVAPIVESVEPNSGPISGGTIITVTGQNFSTEETGKTVFNFGAVEARILDCLPPTICRVISPGIVGKNEETVVWIQAVNASTGAESERITSPETRQTFKYLATPRYACGAFLQSPQNRALFKPGESFKIKWIVKNTGTSAWPAGQDVRYSGGANMGEVSFLEIGKSLAPNDTATITLDAKAPNKAGLHYMNWIVSGQGCSLYIAIRVE